MVTNVQHLDVKTMKPTNQFKDSVFKKDNSSYRSAKEALIGTIVIFIIGILLTLISKEIALGFILFCILYTVMLLRFTQQRNN
jgi:hypothetical protein